MPLNRSQIKPKKLKQASNPPAPKGEKEFRISSPINLVTYLIYNKTGCGNSQPVLLYTKVYNRYNNETHLIAQVVYMAGRLKAK